MASSNSAVSRRMLTLRPGDVITGLGCCPLCKNMKILVLGRQGDGFFDLSLKSEHLDIVRDQQGPYRWDERVMRFVSEGGRVTHHHIDKTATILEGAGLIEIGWFRQLPKYDAARHQISPDGLMGAFTEPGVLAKVGALLKGATNSNEHVAAVSLAIDLIFAGNEHVVDERRMRLLHVFINMVTSVRGKSSAVPDMDAMLAAMALGDLDSPDGFMSALGAMIGGGGRRTAGAFAG